MYDGTYAIVETLESKVSLIPQHRLLSLIQLLRRPACREHLQDRTEPAIQLENCTGLGQREV